MSVSGRCVAGLSLLLAAVAAPSASAHAEESPKPSVSVYVLQGVPQSTVSVVVDGDTVKRQLTPKGVVGPLSMTPGDHTFTFRSANWMVSSSVSVSARSSDVVLHWAADASAKPVVTVFTNDMQKVGLEKGRLTVAHTAVVPPADVRVDGKVLFANIANGEFVSADVPSGGYAVEVTPTGQARSRLLGPLSLRVRAGQLTRVFAIGEPRNQSMDVIVQRLPLKSSGSHAPDLVDAGSAGLVATTPARETTSLVTMSQPTLWAGVTLLALLVGWFASALRRSLAGRS